MKITEEDRVLAAELVHLLTGDINGRDVNGLAIVLAGHARRPHFDRMRNGLRLIDRNGCENLTRGRCSDDPGRTRDSDYTSTQWCPPCIAADALERDA